ncbi:MAG: ABC transporter ATP-binding protein [Proteobacteria bacterium]|nr:ABC transporter ATP-binding protein [Pseudomonadota bacterium]
MYLRSLHFSRRREGPRGAAALVGAIVSVAPLDPDPAASEVGSQPAAGEACVAGAEALISVRGLTKVFLHGGRELQVLRGIDLDVGAGELLSIVGSSGAGKSTFLHILGTLDRASAGVVSFGGRRLNELGAGQLAAVRNREIGFVFQFHHLLPEFTALENVMLPALIGRLARAEALQRAEELLVEVGLAERLSHRPGELSGGEQQRVALARALVWRPKLLLADEPTGNLDSATGHSMHELFFALNERFGTTMLTVTHNPELALRMPRRLRMSDGRLTEDTGPPRPGAV